MNGKTITLAVDSAKQKLKEVLAAVNGLDTTVDFTKLTDEDFQKVGITLSEFYLRLKSLKELIDPAFEKVDKEFNRFNDSRQITLFDDIEVIDNDGSQLTLGFESVTHTTIDRAALDAATGLNISVTGNNLDIYTKASVRAKKQKVVQAVENGILPDNVVKTTTYQQGHIVFDDSNKK